jgi:hypothetical protein
MRMVALGSAGLEISAMGLDCMGLSEFLGPIDRGESLRMLARAAGTDADRAES